MVFQNLKQHLSYVVKLVIHPPYGNLEAALEGEVELVRFVIRSLETCCFYALLRPVNLPAGRQVQQCM